jgi:hypothetical protein
MKKKQIDMTKAHVQKVIKLLLALSGIATKLKCFFSP